MSWGSAPPFSLGVEEELFLVDAETLETAPVFEQIVPEPDERLKPELFACLVETTTPVCRDADEVLAELQRLRAEVARASGRASGRRRSPRARIRSPAVRGSRSSRSLATSACARSWVERLYTQLVCGLHVHVALPDADTALRAFEAVVPWLPVLLALSANSPLRGRQGDRPALDARRSGCW